MGSTARGAGKGHAAAAVTDKVRVGQSSDKLLSQRDL